MSDFFGFLRDRKKPKQERTKSNEIISETAAIGAGTPQPFQRLESNLQTSLTNALKALGLDEGAMAEALISTLGQPQLITWEIQPENSVALPSRIRAGRSVVWRAYSSGRPDIAVIEARNPRSREIETSKETTLFSTRSALVYPIQHDNAVIGVLNIESDRPNAFPPDALTRLETGDVLQAIALEMASIRREQISEATIVDNILKKMDQKIAFTIALDDMTETYYQMLRMAAAVVRPTQVSGGLILVRRPEKNLPTSDANVFAVRAARIGDFNSKPEWDWDSEPSLAHGVYGSKQGKVFRNAQLAENYKDSGTTHGETCEVIVPLIDVSGAALGVIGLVAPGAEAFTEEPDLRRVTQVAGIASYAVSRSYANATNRRHAMQRDCAIELQRLLAPLFPSDGGNITRQEIQVVRQNVGTKILQWATQYTHSEHGAFVLAEVTEGQQTYLAMHKNDQISNAPIKDSVEQRWPATESSSISGGAYDTRQTQSEPDIPARKGKGYIDYFAGAQSEVAVPLLVGKTVLGVLDVESNEPYHFTSDYVDWIEFLAVQAAFALKVIEGAIKYAMDVTLADLSRETDRSIAAIHGETDIDAVRALRNTTALRIIERMCGLLGCWVGRFVTELNTYKSDGSIDDKYGRLFYLASTDKAEVPEDKGREARTFHFGDGISSRAFREKRMIVFNDKATRDELGRYDELGKYFDSDPSRNEGTRSGIFLPVLEGTRITGILNLEGEREDIFTPDAIQACQMAADLISTLMTASRIGILDILRKKLRDIEIDILRTQSANLRAFMESALRDAAELAGITGGWGIIMQTWSSDDKPLASGDKRPIPMIERFSWCEYRELPAEDSNQPNVEVTGFRMEEKEHPLRVEYAPFVEALTTQKPVVILDQDEELGDRRSEPWPHSTNAITSAANVTARSVVCVPLLRPLVGGEKGEIEAAGVLALAHPNVAEFSDFDKEILSMFAESLVGGINAVALLQSRAELVRQVSHDISKTTNPLQTYFDIAREAMEDAADLEDIEKTRLQIQEAREATDKIGSLVGLTNDLTTWFLDLSTGELRDGLQQVESVGEFTDDGLVPQQRTQTPMIQTVQQVLEPFYAPIHTFVEDVFKRRLEWPIEERLSLTLESDERRAHLIRAALFQYVDNAVKYGDPDSPIRLDIRPEQGDIVFEVSSAGLPIPVSERARIFRPNAQGELAKRLQKQLQQKTPDSPTIIDTLDIDQRERRRRNLLQNLLSSGGLGLFQVRNIAKWLDGYADYRNDPRSALQNVFWLSVPRHGH